MNLWPRWLDLEELFYRPVFTRFLPWLGCFIASLLDHLPDSKLIRQWIPKGIAAVFTFLDHLPDSKLMIQWIPKGVSAVFAFLDHLPESSLFSRVIPGIFVAIGRILDEFVDHMLLLGRELFLVDRQNLERTRNHNVFTLLASVIANGLYKIGLLPKKFIRHRSPDDPQWGNSLTNAISFGLMLGTAGLIAAILYVFIRMGVR